MKPDLAVVPSYGQDAMTRAVARQLAKESRLVDLVVVDNAGTYEAAQGEAVHRPGGNIGWLGACNWGMASGFAEGRERVILLNNDVCLSEGFCSGLIEVAKDPAYAPVGLVGPLESGNMGNGQHRVAEPSRFSPRPGAFEVKFVHGVCMLVTKACYEAAGPMDEAQRPYDWGTDVEYALLARRAGLSVVCSEMSYLRHAEMATVRANGHDKFAYSRAARMHVRSVFRAKYGPGWREILGFDWGAPA